MPTRIVFDDGFGSTVPKPEDHVAVAVRRNGRDEVRLSKAAAG
jgi:hypothetical protein